MTPLWEVPAAIAVLVGWLLAPPQTIGQVAAREELRRHVVGPSTGAYTNRDLSEHPVRSAVEGVLGGAFVEPQPAANPRDEAWWRARISNARATLGRNQLLADGLATRVASLTREIVDEHDVAQQRRLRGHLQKAMENLDRQQRLVLSDRRDVEAFQEEARRQGVPPGWLR